MPARTTTSGEERDDNPPRQDGGDDPKPLASNAWSWSVASAMFTLRHSSASVPTAVRVVRAVWSYLRCHARSACSSLWLG
jgi:hypothetical protein